MKDREYVREAIELGANRVLSNPRDIDIVDCVEEIVGTIPTRWHTRISRAIIGAWEEAEAIGEHITDEQRKVIERRVVSIWGLS